MANIIFINAQESSFDYNRSLNYNSNEIKSNLRLGIKAEMLYSDNLDYVGFRFYIALIYNDQQILTYHVTLTFKVDDWKNLTAGKNEEYIKKLKETHEMLSVTVDFLRGSLFVQEKGTPLENFNLPLLSIDHVKENLTIIKAEPECKTK